MSMATSSVGEYFPASMAFIVWRETPSEFAKPACVIPRAWRSSFMTFVTLVAFTMREHRGGKTRRGEIPAARWRTTW